MASLNYSIFHVIAEYQSFVLRAVNMLKQAYDCSDVLSGLKSGKIPRRGVIDGNPYEFHGLGCYIELDGYHIDWDFGPHNRIDGFETWKLWQFTRDHPDIFGVFSNLDELRTAVDQLIVEGKVETMRDLGSTGNLVFLRP